MARKNLKKVFSLWLGNNEGKGDSKRTIWTDGTTVFSYAMPLLTRHPDGSIKLCRREDSPTRTTSCQRSSLAVLLGMERIKFTEVTRDDVARIVKAA